MAGAEGLEPSTYGFGDRKRLRVFSYLDGSSHRLATIFFDLARSDGPDNTEAAALVVRLLDQVTVSIEGRLDVGVPHELLNAFEIHPPLDEH